MSRKRCTKCKKIKVSDESGRCKACNRKKSLDYYHRSMKDPNFKKRMSDKQRAYREDPEVIAKCREYCRKYYKKNSSKLRKKEAARREVNLNDPGFVARETARMSKKRKRIKTAKIPKAMPPVDNKIILDMYKLAIRRNEKAGYRQFEVDHVIPISRDGFHHQDNLRVTTKRNNCGVGGKHSKLDSEWGKVPYCHYRREYYTFLTQEERQ